MDLTRDEIKLWESLRKLARNGSTTTYEDSMFFIGLRVEDPEDRSIYFSKMLDDINSYEFENNRPMLTAVVVHKNSINKKAISIPGQGFFTTAKKLGLMDSSDNDKDFWRKELKKVHSYWLKH